MKGFDVLHVKSAVKARNKFDLSRSHLTTMDFGEIVPLMVEETVPGDKFSVGSEYFSRMAPLVKPTYGKFSFKTVSGFVPYHQIADDADAWFAGKTTWEGSTPIFRGVLVRTLALFVSNYCCEQAQSLDEADFTWTAGTSTVQLGKFTAKGRYYVKVLEALGYALPTGADIDANSTWYNGDGAVVLSAYPLIAFFKLYNDYMSQSQRYNTSVLSNILRCIKHNIAVSNVYVSTGSNAGQIISQGLNSLFSNLRLNYENDYFTSAWQLPNQPLANSENVQVIDVPGLSRVGVENTVIQDGSDNYTYAAVAANTARINQRALDVLRSFDNWVRRHNYAGSRPVQQLYARFGIKTDDYRSNYAHVIKTDSFPIQVGDVTATADSGAAILGEYAGKGIMSASNGVSYDADDYGLFITLGYFTVYPMMSYGFDRRVLRNKPLDFYNPEFDGVGVDAISFGEVYANPLGVGQSDSTSDSSVFGFTERYNSYKYGRDVITGEFRDYHAAGDMNTWHTGRNLADIRANGDMIAQSSSMNTLEQSGSQYNRIFSITNDSVNHFYLTCRFKVDAFRPMLNLNQSVNLGEGDTVLPRNGNVIS